MGTQPPSQKGGGAPIFGPCLLWPNGWMDQDGTWHGGRPWSRPQCARWRHSSPPQKGDRAPQFSAHLYCGQTDAWIKMPLGTEVGLGLRNIVFDSMWTQLPPEKGHTHSYPILAHVYICTFIRHSRQKDRQRNIKQTDNKNNRTRYNARQRN